MSSIDLSPVSFPAAVDQYVRDEIRARSARVEALVEEALAGTPPEHRWRLTIIVPWHNTLDGLAEPGVASWLGDFPPGHPDARRPAGGIA